MHKYVSPTQLKLWASSRDSYVTSYLVENRPPRFEQTQPMAIGSAFDAYAKCYLFQNLFGHNDGGRMECETIFESQVESQHRDWGRIHGQVVFDMYKETGALSDLMLELNKASDDPRFEFTVEASIPHTSCVNGIPILGKPDVYFHNALGTPVIIDWKVNGYCANRPTSPKKGYLKLRTAGSRKHTMHKDCQPMTVDGLMINVAHPLEDVDKIWAEQITFYGWTLGEPVGSQFFTGIDQICGPPPLLRVATHRCRISQRFQQDVYARLGAMWSQIQSGYIYEDLGLTREQSDEKVMQLGDVHKAYETGSKHDDWYHKAMTQRSYYY